MVMPWAVPSIYVAMVPLVINADRTGDYGVAFFAEGTNSVLSVADTS